jgi:hypothetical protein
MHCNGTAYIYLALLLSASLCAAVQAAQRPGIPSNVNACNQTVTWKAPKNDGGTKITGYVILCLSPTGTNRAASVSKSTTTTYVFSYYKSLSVGKEYTCSVSATNAVGAGPAKEAPPFKPETRGPNPSQKPPNLVRPKPSPPPKIIPPPSLVQATATASISGGTATGAAIISGGSGYTSTPTVTVSDPNPLAATVVIQIDSVGNPSTGSLVSGPNGPYTGVPEVVEVSGICVDENRPGTGQFTSCSGPRTSIQVNNMARTGSLCIASDFNIKCDVKPDGTGFIIGGTGSCVTVGGSGVTSVRFPGVSTTSVWCMQSLTVVLSTNTLQPAVTAQMSATISAGAVSSLTIMSPGSGYLTPPVITIAPP